MANSGRRRHFATAMRSAQAAVAVLLGACGVYCSWVGGSILAVELISSYKDSAYLPLALIPLAVATAAATAA